MRPLAAVALALLACQTAPKPAPSADAPPSAAPAPEPTLEAPKLRLPDGVRPKSQALDLRVVPGDEKFEGKVTIALEVSKSVDVIWLNGAELEPLSATVGGAPAKAKVASDHFLAVVPLSPLQPGATTLELTYRGVLSKKNTAGLFQLVEGGVPYAYTHFEPLDARRAFPCFDEPSFKIPWSYTLHVKREHVALANTPQVEERDEPNGMKAVKFATTKPLPSYLVALAVGPFDVVEAGTWGKNKTAVRIVAPKGKAPDTKYAVEVTGQILEALEGYFGIPYPYEKLDSISLPVNTGAMENPGLVTYGHQMLLSRVAEDTPGRQRGYAGVCAHELAHQWFGDLVTMAWWNDLWLNEAFATWMTTKVITAWRPKWDFDVAAVQRRSGALGSDGLVNARRVRQPIETNDDIANAFDGITYGKGASVISMFESWVGPDAFQKGVRRYLEEHAYGNATAEEFLAAISKEAGKDVATPFNTFLDQAGAPRVAIELVCSKGAPPKLTLSQRRYLPVGSKGDAAMHWQVPVCARWSVKGKEDRACTLLTEEKGELALGTAKVCPDWVLPNDGMQGHYRASLSGTTDLRKLLEKAGKRLSVAERVGLLGDINALVGSGDVDLSLAIASVPVVAPAPEENRHLVASAMGLAWMLNDVVVPDPLKPKAEAFIRANFGTRAKKLGLTVAAADDEDVRLLRPGLMSLVGREGKEAAVRKQALELAAAWLANRKAVHADLIETVLVIAGDTSDPALHAALLDAVKSEKDRADRNRMLSGLSVFREPSLVKRNFELVLGSELDARESVRLLWGAASDTRTRDLAYDFVKAHWDELVARLPKDSGAGLVFVASGYCDEKPRDDARAFFDGRSTKYMGGPRNFALAFEGIDLCMAYRARQRPTVSAFLEKWKP